MTARAYSGAEAAAAGLVHRVVPSTELDREAESMGREMAALSPLSVQGSKRALQTIVDDLSDPRGRAEDSVAAIDELVAQAYASEDLQEGLRAMQEKRAPKFTGG
jgi:enoyl-CoA hydratase/carnithine racemase